MANAYLDLATRELKLLNAEIEVAQQSLASLIETRDAWATIVRNAQSKTHPPAVVNGKAPGKSSDNGAHSDSEPDDERGYGWRIDAVRDMFREAGARGLSARDVWRSVQARGISKRQGFVHSTLGRLVKKQGQLVRRRGRYYATPLLLTEPEGKTEKGSTEALPFSA